jgi:hypothetical protein
MKPIMLDMHDVAVAAAAGPIPRTWSCAGFSRMAIFAWSSSG